MAGLLDIMNDIDAEVERARDYLGRLEAMQAAGQRKSVKTGGSERGPTVESVRRAKRRKGVNRRQGKPVHTDAQQGGMLVEYLRDHPGSTAGEVAEALDLKRNSVSTKMTDMARKGTLKKEERGYSAA